MATRGGKKRQLEETPAPRPKRGRPGHKKVVETTEQEPVPVKKVTSTPSKKLPAHKQSKTMGIKRSVVKKVTPSPADTVQKADGQESQASESNSQRYRRVVGSITKILRKSVVDEQQIMNKKDADDSIIDSDDQYDKEVDNGNHSQLTMDGDKDYTKGRPGVPESDEDLLNKGDEEYVNEDESKKCAREHDGSDNSGDDGTDDEGNDGELNVSKMRVIEHEKSVFDDPSKTHEQWWSDDNTREETLCELWRDEKCLYVMNFPGYKDPAIRDTVLKRFSTILHVPPHIIDTRMQSIRNAYQKMHRGCKSGSSPIGKTSRQREILRLVPFLKEHIKTAESITSYKGKSNKKVYSYQRRGDTPRKCKAKSNSSRSPDVDEKLQAIMNNSLTPIPKQSTPTPSEEGSEEEYQEQPRTNTKHFSRNARLHDAKTVEVSARRSLRLTPNAKGKIPKKTSDLSKTKSSTKASSVAKPVASSTPTTASKKIVAKTVTSKAKKASAEKEPEDNFTAINQARANKRKTPTAVQKDVTSVKTTTAADRRAAMASTSNDEPPSYSINVDPAWYEQQGAAYRKAQADFKAKKQKEKDNPMVEILQQKAVHMARMTNSLEGMAAQSNVTSAALAKPPSPIQLWADSLVPHIEKLDKSKQRKIMLQIMTLAFEAADESDSVQ